MPNPEPIMHPYGAWFQKLEPPKVKLADPPEGLDPDQYRHCKKCMHKAYYHGDRAIGACIQCASLNKHCPGWSYPTKESE